MNKEPIENAKDTDLQLSHAALLRAARRARELAVQTGTLLVVSEHGVVKHLRPDGLEQFMGVAEENPGKN